MTALVPVPFDGDTLFAGEIDGAVYVALKPICERLGLAWTGQHDRLQRDPVLSEGIRVIRIPSAGGTQETTCLKLEMLNGWLFGIDVGRLKDEQVRETVLTYKRRCYQVLHDHFFGPALPAPVATPISERPPVGVEERDETALALPPEERNSRLAYIRGCREVFGPAAAAAAWKWMGFRLPAGAATSLAMVDAAAAGRQRAVLAAFMAWKIDGEHSLADVLAKITNKWTEDKHTWERLLLPHGLRVFEYDDDPNYYLTVANDFPARSGLFGAGEWDEGVWKAALQQIPGAEPTHSAVRFFGDHQARGIEVPIRKLAAAARGAA